MGSTLETGGFFIAQKGPTFNRYSAKTTRSRSEPGNDYRNTCTESFFSYAKAEQLYAENPKTFEEAKYQITIGTGMRKE
ncbi:hypothetical protein [Saccharibacillus endophyticus]|uniref:Uncharacterized protein n=1 Tax=Saccharibacillus endophyticus TaxID=2060666 RepID=A0ABQ1ZLR0_9BACL|nr:hypothetical protein [Saccharibacillus endophyticus]GGH70860.1 hypothetical protein GCM10007362_07370 [Saccharibacillus endophyticus]